MTPKPFSSKVWVSTPIGDSLVVDWIYKGYVVTLQGFDTWVYLILLDMFDVDVILRMDLVSPTSCYVSLLC